MLRRGDGRALTVAAARMALLGREMSRLELMYGQLLLQQSGQRVIDSGPGIGSGGTLCNGWNPRLNE